MQNPRWAVGMRVDHWEKISADHANGSATTLGAIVSRKSMNIIDCAQRERVGADGDETQANCETHGMDGDGEKDHWTTVRETYLKVRACLHQDQSHSNFPFPLAFT